MNNEKKYSAFISYRHLPLDENVAVRVQNMLESYRQPRGVAEGKKIGRLFRCGCDDFREELELLFQKAVEDRCVVVGMREAPGRLFIICF